MRHIVCKVKYGHRVYGIAHVAGLEMQMGSGASAGVSAQGNGVAGFHVSPRLDKKFRQMAVDRLKIIGMPDHYIVAVAFSATFKFGKAHPSVKCGIYCVADLYFQVHPFVHAAESAPVAVG